MAILRKKNNDEGGGDSGADIVAKPAYAFWIVVVGLACLTIIFVITVFAFDKAKDVVTVFGSASGLIAALIGAYFGIRGATYASLAAGQSSAGAGASDGGSSGGGGTHQGQGRGGGGQPRRAKADEADREPRDEPPRATQGGV